MSARQNKWRRDNPVKNQAGRERERTRRYTPDAKRALKDRTLKRRYDISMVDYDLMLARQNGVCAICELPERAVQNTSPTRELRPLAVDHDHQTGGVRGLLCSSCNARLAAIDDAEFLARALRYLQEAR